ncbi:MAG: phosphotransferase [Acetobacteraceae bacterium]|jgi:aminoglycoside/choline kinase family phosphotransferase|nr:phosphotransferase [Acetobacteraceae bacterium]
MTMAFLKNAGFAMARLDPLPSDASARRYTRLLGGPRPALLMEAPPPENTRPFIAIAAHILGVGLSAPEIIAADPEAGLVLLEDFGDATHAALLDAGAPAPALYAEAAETLAALHEAPPPAGLPAWDAAAMARATAATFLDWWWPAMMGSAPDDALRNGLDGAIRAMLAPFADTQGFVHRDYFPANLMRLDARTGARRTGLLDFQDAGLGHPAYDLVSLVQDARRDVAPEARDAAIESYFAARPSVARDDFTAAMAASAAQRHLRVAALWVRLSRRDNKHHYLVHGPRCWRLLAEALDHPATAPLSLWLDAVLPRHLRRNPDPAKEPA